MYIVLLPLLLLVSACVRARYNQNQTLTRSRPHSSHTLSKRSTASSCTGLNSSTYKTDSGATFDVLCSTGSSYEGVLEVLYMSAFTDCVTSCATYESTSPCIGIQYEPSVAGPNGLSLCYLLWNMTGAGNGSDIVDSARLQTSALVCVSSCAVNLSNLRVNPGIILL